jgi:hypothetical protein
MGPKKKLYLWLGIVYLMPAVISLTGCTTTLTDSNTATNDQTQNSGTSSIRFIHAASSGGELDFAYWSSADQQYYLIQSETTYGHQYGYFDFSSGSLTVKAYPSFSNISVSRGDIALADGKRYSFIVHDYQATVDTEMLIVADTLVLPSAGMAFIRFINLGTDAPVVSISEQDSSQILTNVSPFDYSRYLQVAAGTYRFTVKDYYSQEILIQINPQTFLSTKNYTIILSGSLTGLTAISFNAMVYRDTGL